MKTQQSDIIIIGAGIIGISTAYYLSKERPSLKITIIDQNQPMSFTSAQSGENYRNWWPHPTMKRLTEQSIKLMEEISVETNDRINMNRRGYLLATRKKEIESITDQIIRSYGSESGQLVRFHQNANRYQAPLSERWQDAPIGVDILENPPLVQQMFPHLDPSIEKIVHIRNAGMLDSNQLASFMLEKVKEYGGKLVYGKVNSVTKSENFNVQLDNNETLMSEKLINASGPFISKIANMLNIDLPIDNILQQKIAFPDTLKAVPRNQPFAIDLDEQDIDWTEEEKLMLADDPEFKWLTETFPGSIHSRPEGGDHGNWIKLGWAFNEKKISPSFQPELMDNFPEIVLRGASRLNPALKGYYAGLPRNMIHYGGYYTTTEENWPLIGETEVEGFYINGAMSGFGTMAACAGGKLCTQWVLDLKRPEYANELSLARYQDSRFMEELRRFDTGML